DPILERQHDGVVADAAAKRPSGRRRVVRLDAHQHHLRPLRVLRMLDRPRRRHLQGLLAEQHPHPVPPQRRQRRPACHERDRAPPGGTQRRGRPPPPPTPPQRPPPPPRPKPQGPRAATTPPPRSRKATVHPDGEGWCPACSPRRLRPPRDGLRTTRSAKLSCP